MSADVRKLYIDAIRVKTRSFHENVSVTLTGLNKSSAAITGSPLRDSLLKMNKSQ